MVVELAFKTKVLLWSGVVLGSLAVGILGYAIVRYYNYGNIASTFSYFFLCLIA